MFIKKSIPLVLCVLCTVFLICSCGSPKDNGGLTFFPESETENVISTVGETEKTAEETKEDIPQKTDYEAELAIPEINLDEIVWAGGWPAVSGISSSYFAIDYLAISPDKVVSIDTLNDEDWYGVLIDISEGHLYPMDPNERSYWIDGIDEYGKLTVLINDYNSKYKACMDFCEKLPVDKINDSLRTDEYMELHNQAVSAKNAWKEYCENFYKATETRLQEEFENETDYFVKLNLRRTIDFNQNASRKMNMAFISVENNFDMRLRLLGLYNYGTVTGNSEGTNIYVAQIKDLKKIKERVHSFEVLQVYWAPNPYAEN